MKCNNEDEETVLGCRLGSEVKAKVAGAYTDTVSSGYL